MLVWRRAQPVELQNDEEEEKAADVLHLTVRLPSGNDVYALRALRDEPLYSFKWRLARETDFLLDTHQLLLVTGGKSRWLPDSANQRTMEELGVLDGAVLEVERSEALLLDRYAHIGFAALRITTPTFNAKTEFYLYSERDRTVADLQLQVAQRLGIPVSQLLFRLAHVPSIRWQDNMTLNELQLPAVGPLSKDHRGAVRPSSVDASCDGSVCGPRGSAAAHPLHTRWRPR